MNRESLTIESLTVELLTVESLTVALQASPNHLQLNRLRPPYRIAYSCITGESESLTVESLTVESLTGMSQSLTVNRLRFNRLQSNRLGSNHLRSNRLRCYADRLCDRVLLGHRISNICTIMSGLILAPPRVYLA